MADARELERLARAAGFHLVGFTPVRPTPRADAFDRWLAAGHAAEMAPWLARGRDVRMDPRIRHPWARTALVLAVAHHHRRPPDPGGRTGLVARYAWGRDYHNLIGKRLRKLRAALTALGVRSWGGVDTAPILERAWAEAAGVGFSGKNTVQILAGRTSWLLLAALFVDVDIDVDVPPPPSHSRPAGRDPRRPSGSLDRRRPSGSLDRRRPSGSLDPCGSCARCLHGCPTDAFPAPRVLDARRCISYWTIEARDLAPRDLRPGFGRWVFGCDRCQEVCPHNHAPPEPDPDDDDLRPRHAHLDLDAVLAATDEALRARFVGTPLIRPGAAGLKRNALIALGNLGDPGASPAIRAHGLAHPAPVVRAAAVWALHQLGERVTLASEAAPEVVAELEAPRSVSSPR